MVIDWLFYPHAAKNAGRTRAGGICTHVIAKTGYSAPSGLWGILLAVGILHACASAPVRDITVHDGPQGSVYLARVPQAAFHASHPLLLDETLVMRLLRGVQVEPRQGKVTTFIFGSPEPVRAFSENDVQFLAPHIAAALAQAAPHHIVEFQVMHPTPSGPEAAAALYAYGSSLYLTLTQYRYRLERPDRGTPGTSSDRESPDFTGLYQREVRFVPEAALSRDIDQAPRPPGYGQLAPLVINYERLAKVPEPPAAPRPPSPAASASPPPVPTSVPDPPPIAATPSPVPAKIQMELDRLKEENRLLRQQLAEQAAALKALQEKEPKAKEQKKKKRQAK